MTTSDIKWKALLILGPTGSGKTPVGNLIQKNGLNGVAVAHLDFGEILRQVVSGEASWGMSEADRAFLVQVLASGALLENENFHLANKILKHFVTRWRDQVDAVALNGLPRHVDQAAQVAETFCVETVLHLDCSEAAVFRRIQENTGGDRTERADDTNGLVRQKLHTFAMRTRPLLDYYRKEGARIVTVPVDAHTCPEDVHRRLLDQL